jgi:tetratricopeptide (TPR) repeat protein
VKSVRPDGSGVERGTGNRPFIERSGTAARNGRKPRPAKGIRPPDQQPRLRKPVALSDAIGWEKDTAPIQARIEKPEPVRQRARKLPEQVADDLHTMLGTRRGGKVAVVLNEAAKAFERERFTETARILRPLIEEAPDSPAVRELFGLACYREGKWAEAIRHLEVFVELTGSDEQHPVLADAHRALKHYGQVANLWEELSQSSPSAHLVAEGRIVMAGSLADQGKLLEAIALIERGSIESKKPKDHHLRLWYCLADLYERAGDIPRARDRFQRIMAIDTSYVNVPERLANLG